MRNAPQLPDFVDDDAKAHFEELQRLLTELGIGFRLNSSLVRGLDYYTHTVFEWVTTQLGAQGTVCAGGRYDGLVELLGGKPTAGAGFAMGVDRLVLLHEEIHAPKDGANEQGGSSEFVPVDVYVAVAEPGHLGACLALAADLRREVPGIRVRTHVGGGKLKSQMKKADACGARYALLVGSQEIADNTVTCKSLREAETEQLSVDRAQLAEHLRSRL